jgi:O-antigen/teichoic acid export membrane protein
MSRFSPVLRSTLIYAPGILFTRISALLLLVISTRLVNQTEYGLLTLVVTVGEFTDIAMTNWLRIALLRLGGKTNVSRGSLWLAGRVLLGTTALALLASLAASRIIVPERWVEFAFAVSSYLLASAIGRFALTVLQMQQRHSLYTLLETLRAVLQFALPIGAVFLVRDSFFAMSLGSSLGTLIAGLVAASVALRGVVPGPSRFTYREFFALGIPLIVMALVGFGLNSAERVFLKVYYDAAAVAVFAAAYALARQPIDMIANAINIGAFPEVVSKFDDEGSAAAGHMLSDQLALMLRLSLPAAALLCALCLDIVALVLPSGYQGNINLLFPVIAFSVICTNVTSFVYGTVVHAHKRPWLLIIANGAGTVGTVVFSLLLIPPFGALGAAAALAAGSTMALIACVLIAERLTPIPVPWRDIGVSVVIAAATGLAGLVVSSGLGEAAPVLKLLAGGTAGAAVFLGLNSLFHPEQALALLARLRPRSRAA